MNKIKNYKYSIISEHITIIDTYLNNPIFILLDEHNGNKISNFCKNNLLRILNSVKIPEYNIFEYIEKIKTIPIINTLYKLDEIIKYTEIFNQFIYDLDNELYKYSMEFYNGCNIIITYIIKKYIIQINLGNSKALLLNKDNSYKILSIVHNPSNPIEKKRIIKYNGLIENNKINNYIPMSRCLGYYIYKNKNNINLSTQIIINTPTVIYHKFKNNEKYIIIGSNNIWEVFTNNKLIFFIEYLYSNNIYNIEEIIILIQMKAKKIGCIGPITLILIEL